MARQSIGLMHRCTADVANECGSLLSRTIVEGNYINDDRAYAAMTFLPGLGFFFVSQKSCSRGFNNVLLFLIGSCCSYGNACYGAWLRLPGLWNLLSNMAGSCLFVEARWRHVYDV